MRGDPVGVSLPASHARAQTVDAVLGASQRDGSWRLVAALSVALTVHGFLCLCARERELPSVARVQSQRSRETTVDLTVPTPAPRPQQKAQATKPIRQPVTQRVQTVPRPRAEPSAPPPTPAQAAAIIAREPRNPVDLTGDTFVTGKGMAFSGGVTTTTGTNAVAAQTRERGKGATPVVKIDARDRTRAISLESQNWSCPWPRSADAEQIDEQIVIIRVVVAADGHADSAEVIADPGHGFGQSATNCALRTRFSPAWDRNGDPIRARSPPIRIRFTRGSAGTTGR